VKQAPYLPSIEKIYGGSIGEWMKVLVWSRVEMR